MNVVNEVKDVISVVDIKKKYKNFEAIKGLSFNVKEGEIFGFLGPNGAGKTTTIKILTGQLLPDEGTAEVLGYNIKNGSDKIREKIGVVFEDQNFYSRLTVWQNLIFFARLYGKGAKEVREVLDYVKLCDRKNTEAQKLSRGLKQRLLIARALIPDPSIIFLDEPTVGLDPHIAREIRAIFTELKARGKTIFLTTHYMEEADELCDRVAIINNGQIVMLDTPERLKEVKGAAGIVVKVLDENMNINNEQIFPADTDESLEFIKKLAGEGIPYRIDVRKSSLEDAFIYLTGASLK